MIVMPANATGWFWHCLARETGRIGHLFSPRAQRGPWPWMPYALDNGAFSAWNQDNNTWDEAKWSEQAWREMVVWAGGQTQKPLWAIVPDVPGNSDATFARWGRFAPSLGSIPLALAVQNGMTPEMVRQLLPAPAVIAVGGSTDWKWETVEMWAREFPRVHLLRCNSPAKLEVLEALGVESCDGTGWNRGDRKQTGGLEEWCRARATPTTERMTPFVSRARAPKQLFFL